MGSTHHALEDYGILGSLQNMQVYVPAFDSDVAPMTVRMADTMHPSYLRLGRDEKPSGWQAPPYAPWRRILAGGGPTILAVGPLAGALVGRLSRLDDAERPVLWVVTELPFEGSELPTDFLADLSSSGRLAIVEEHVAQGGMGDLLGRRLLAMGKAPSVWHHFCAKGYPSGRYGSQAYHRKECGLDPDSVWEAIRK